MVINAIIGAVSTLVLFFLQAKLPLAGLNDALLGPALFFDDFIEVRTDIILNEMIPSEQRATLISVNSIMFSIVMIVMSTLMGSIM